MNYDEFLNNIQITQEWLLEESYKIMLKIQNAKTPEEIDKYLKIVHELRFRNSNLKKDLNNLTGAK